MAREGLVPTLLGTAVTGAALIMRMPALNKEDMKSMDMSGMIATGLLGFGLAHVLLGSIDMIRDR